MITGNVTHVGAGSSVSFSNSGVTASCISVSSSTQLTATVTVAAGASLGTSNLTVTTGSEVATGTGLFTVTAGTPVITAINPNSGLQGQVLTGVVITGNFTHFAAGSTVSFSNINVTASNISVTSSTQLTATVTIAAGAALGSSNVTVTTGSEVATGANLFTVGNGTPVITAISPNIGAQGQVLTGVVITGNFTHFAAGSTVSFSNINVTASNISVTNSTQLTATITIAAGAATGPSNVTVTTGTEVATGGNLFTITTGTPIITAISPNTGQQGKVLTGVVITGNFTHFAAGSTVSFSNINVTASNISVTNATQLTATITIAAGAATGPSNVTVTTGTEVATGGNLFTIASGTPVVSAISPNAGQQGQVLTGVVITGSFTHFATGSAVSFSNAGVTASNVSVTSATPTQGPRR